MQTTLIHHFVIRDEHTIFKTFIGLSNPKLCIYNYVDDKVFENGWVYESFTENSTFAA